jgi:hypothetical protein
VGHVIFRIRAVLDSWSCNCNPLGGAATEYRECALNQQSSIILDGEGLVAPKPRRTLMALLARIFVVPTFMLFMTTGQSQSGEQLNISPPGKANLLPIPTDGAGLLGRPPPGDRWIWFFVLGPRSYPIPVLYISTTPFTPIGLESLVVVSRPAFEMVAKSVGSSMSECVDQKSGPFTVEVTKKSGTSLRQCALPRERACVLLDTLNRQLRLTDEEMKPLRNFFIANRCARGPSP